MRIALTLNQAQMLARAADAIQTAQLEARLVNEKLMQARGLRAEMIHCLCRDAKAPAGFEQGSIHLEEDASGPYLKLTSAARETGPEAG